jgi:hypothetical protein
MVGLSWAFAIRKACGADGLGIVLAWASLESLAISEAIIDSSLSI